MTESKRIEQAYAIARERYAQLGVDTEAALRALRGVAISLQCWQGDDVAGFERADASLEGGGIQVTGSYPGRARNAGELQMDLEKVYSLLPGRHRLNLHAMYGEFGGRRVDRDNIDSSHFAGWISWAAAQHLCLDFNATCFSHPKAASGFTLSHHDRQIRDFWIAHVQRCREISADIGRAQGSACIHNLWIPDGFKDIPADRFAPRERLLAALDEIFERKFDAAHMKDALESKLFGIGSEAYVVGSHEFYLAYAVRNGLMPCFDMGHYHPTELVADKLSAVLPFVPELLLHISRGLRWDSDHVVILNDELGAVTEEIIRSGAVERIHIALDFFDASINRVGAWVVGARATLKGLLRGLLQPVGRLVEYELEENYFARLALLEAVKCLPAGAVWDYYCLQTAVPGDMAVIEAIRDYEQQVLSRR